MNTSLNLDQLAAFLAAARMLHFTHAASSLGIAQPTLSLRIKQLERELGTPLFDRIGRRVRLTSAGELFAAQAGQAVAHLERAQQAVADLEGLRGGSLRIGITHILATGVLPQVVGEFHQRHPAVRLVVEKLTSDGVEQGLIAGTLDLGVTFTPPEAPELLAQPLFEERIVLAVASRHPLARRRSIKLRELDEVPLALTGVGFATRRLLEELAAKSRIRLNVSMEFNDIDLLLAVVRRGAGATVLARRAVGQSSGLVLIPITEPAMTRTATLLWHRDRYRTAAARAIAHLVVRRAAK